MLTGSCYCGKVRYESARKILIFANCHCPDCRKFSGSAFSSVLAVEENGFKIVAGPVNARGYKTRPCPATAPVGHRAEVASRSGVGTPVPKNLGGGTTIPTVANVALTTGTFCAIR